MLTEPAAGRRSPQKNSGATIGPRLVGRDVETHGGILFRFLQNGKARARKLLLTCNEVADQVLVFDAQVKAAKQFRTRHVGYPYVELRGNFLAIFVDLDAVFDAHDPSPLSASGRHMIIASWAAG